MKLDDDDFTLFGLPERHALDRAEVDARWRQLQAEVHPDRFAGDGAAAQRIAMQWAVRVNEAYQRLKDPLKRAAYLCELGGAPIRAESNTAMPAKFLMQQMQWREALEEAATQAALDALQAEVAALRGDLLAECAQALDEQVDRQQAVSLVRSLMFIERFASDIDKRYDQLPASANS